MCLNETVSLINATIVRIESNLLTQSEVDSIYADIRSIFELEMEKLPNIPGSQLKKGRKLLNG